MPYRSRSFFIMRNNRLSNTEQGRFWRRSLQIFLIFFGILILFTILLLRVWLPSKAIAIAYEIERLAQEKESLEEENTMLSLEIAKLKTPERIERIAINELNMVRSSEIEVEVINKAQ